MFWCVLFQIIPFALIMAYSFETMDYLGTPIWLKVLTYLAAVLSPYYTKYMVTVLRDNLYSYGVMLITIEIIYMIIKKWDYFKDRKHRTLLFVSICLIILFRKNGIYLVIPIVCCLIGYFIWLKRNIFGSPKCLYKGIRTLLFPVVVAITISAIINVHWGVKAGSIREALSLPFQQTARYIVEYGDEVTDGEKEVISKVLDYDSVTSNYDPLISDPVKDTFNENATIKDLENYFIIWARQFMKHPSVYIQASFNQNYLLWYPFEINDGFIVNVYTGSEGELGEMLLELTGIHTVKALEKIHYILNELYELMFSVPVISILSNIAFYNLVLLGILVFSIAQKKYFWLLASLPVWVSNIIIILAPCIKNHARYGLPIVYSAPILIALYIYSCGNSECISRNKWIENG